MITHPEYELNYLLGRPVHLQKSDIKAYPFTLGETIDFGEAKYLQIISLFTMPKSTLASSLQGVSDKDIDTILRDKTNLEVLKFLLSQSSEVEDLITSFFSLSFKVNLNITSTIDYAGDTRVSITFKNLSNNLMAMDEEIYTELASVLRDFNQISEYASEYDQPKYAHLPLQVRKQLKRMEEIKKMHENDKNDGAKSFYDIISTVVTLSNGITFSNISNMTYYQVYEQYFKLISKDNHATAMIMLPHSTEVSKVAHWSKTSHDNK